MSGPPKRLEINAVRRCWGSQRGWAWPATPLQPHLQLAGCHYQSGHQSPRTIPQLPNSSQKRSHAGNLKILSNFCTNWVLVELDRVQLILIPGFFAQQLVVMQSSSNAVEFVFVAPPPVEGVGGGGTGYGWNDHTTTAGAPASPILTHSNVDLSRIPTGELVHVWCMPSTAIIGHQEPPRPLEQVQ